MKLPEGWEEIPFGKIAEFKNGINYNSSENGFKIKFLGVGDFKDRKEIRDISLLKSILINDLPNKESLLQNGDLVFVRSNGNKELVGRCVIVYPKKEILTYSGFSIRGRIKSEITSSIYISYLMQFGILRRILKKDGRGTNISNLNQNILENLVLLLPPLPEQEAIADILSTWDEAIEKTERLIAAKEKQFKWLLKTLISDQCNSNNPDWKKVKLGEVGNSYSGLSGKNKEHFGNGKPYIPYLNIYQNSRININQIDYVEIKDNEKQNLVKKGDVFFTVSSETPDEVGISSVLLDDIQECYLNSFCFGWRINNTAILPEYLQYYFRSEFYRKQTLQLSQGATRFNISKNELMKTFIYYPSKFEQKNLYEILNNSHSEINYFKAIVQKYKQQKQGLMQKLLTGKWRVNSNLNNRIIK